MLNSRSPWYVSKSIPHGLGNTAHVVALETQDLLVGSDGQDKLVVYRLSTGELIREFDDLELNFDVIQGSQDGDVYGCSAYRLSRIDLKTGESIPLMTTSDDPPAQELICGVSSDGESVLIAARDADPSGVVPYGTPLTYRIRDLNSGQLRWELPTKDTSQSQGVFSADGQRVGLQIGDRFQVWDIGKNEKVHDSSLNLGRYPTPRLFPDGRRALGSYRDIFDLESDTHLSQVGSGFHATIVNDSFLVTDDKARFSYWRRRRPEGSWSPLNFPVAWITGTLAFACVVSVIGHFRRPNGNEHASSPK